MKIALYNRDHNDNIEALVSTLRAKGVCLARYGEDFSSWEDLPGDTDLFLSLGGDGTFLQSLTFIRDRRIPVAGINFGRLGFLTTVKADQEQEWIDDILAGHYEVEQRSLLSVAGTSLPDDFYPYALNEISLHRNGASMLSVDIRIDGRPLPAYWADGIVIATPTGSTAYSLSVGGPVVMPDSQVLVLAPIAPHNLNVRPLVVPFDSVLEMSFASREGEAVLTLDNRSIKVSSNARFVISKGDYGLRYVSLYHNNFINALRTKLLWGEDKRNNL